MPAAFPDGDITLRIKVSNEFSDSFDFHKQQTLSMPFHEESGMMQLNELTTQGLTLNALLINDNELLFKPEEQSTPLDTILNLDIVALTEETVVEFSSATFAMPVKVTSEYIEDQNISSLY